MYLYDNTTGFGYEPITIFHGDDYTLLVVGDVDLAGSVPRLLKVLVTSYQNSVKCCRT